MTSGAALVAHVALAEAPQRIPLTQAAAEISFLAVTTVDAEGNSSLNLALGSQIFLCILSLYSMGPPSIMISYTIPYITSIGQVLKCTSIHYRYSKCTEMYLSVTVLVCI
jgi:hypothetical protein